MPEEKSDVSFANFGDVYARECHDSSRYQRSKPSHTPAAQRFGLELQAENCHRS